MVLGVRSHAFCMAEARFDTSSKPSSNDIARAATKAENSPSEWPATASGWKASPAIIALMTEWRNKAGCVTLVCFSASAVPSNMMSVIRKPSNSLARSK